MKPEEGLSIIVNQVPCLLIKNLNSVIEDLESDTVYLACDLPTQSIVFTVDCKDVNAYTVDEAIKKLAFESKGQTVKIDSMGLINLMRAYTDFMYKFSYSVDDVSYSLMHLSNPFEEGYKSNNDILYSTLSTLGINIQDCNLAIRKHNPQIKIFIPTNSYEDEHNPTEEVSKDVINKLLGGIEGVFLS